MTRSMCLRGAVLPDQLDRGPVDVLIMGGRIAAVDPAGTVQADETLEVPGTWIFPGLIDAHVHPIHAETFQTVGEQGLQHGITTVLNHLYPTPAETIGDAVTRSLVDGRRAGSDHGVHIRITPDRLADLTQLRGQLREVLTRRQGVVSAKAFLAHSNPEIPVSFAELTVLANLIATLDIPLVVHAEPGDVIDTLETLHGPASDLLGHDARRPVDLESATVAMVTSIARAVNVRAYVAHISSDVALDAVVRARALGTRVRGETCVHYLELSSEDTELGAFGRVAPPLRTKPHVAAMRRRANDPNSAIDVLASDHCGYARKDKPANNFAGGGNGLPGLDAMLPLLLDAIISGTWFTSADLVRLCCMGPADTFGLSGKGALEPGYDADLIVVDPSGHTTIGSGRARDIAASPYDGRRFRGELVGVLRRGELAVWDHQDRRPIGPARPVVTSRPRW